jgi:ElaB protein
MNTEENISEEHFKEEAGRDIPHEIIKTGAEVYGKAQHAASEAFDKTSRVASEAYDKTSEVAGDAVDRVKTFTRENPEKAALIAMGVGVGLGMILCSRQSRTSRTANAVIDSLYDVARAFLR